MAENKKSIIVYADWLEHFENLTDDEAGKLIKHFFRYVNGLNPQTPDRITEIAFAPIKASLKRDLEKWEKTVKDRSVNGRLGNLKKYHSDLYEKVYANAMTLEEAENVAKHRKASLPDSVAIKTVANVADNVSVSVSDNVNDINNKDISLVEVYPTFDDFWNEYDKKVGDRKKLKSKFDKLSQLDKEKIMAYVPNYKLAQPDKAFRKNPETFLNNKSWNDEIIFNNNIQSKTYGTSKINQSQEFSDLVKSIRSDGVKR